MQLASSILAPVCLVLILSGSAPGQATQPGQAVLIIGANTLGS